MPPPWPLAPLDLVENQRVAIRCDSQQVLERAVVERQVIAARRGHEHQSRVPRDAVGDVAADALRLHHRPRDALAEHGLGGFVAVVRGAVPRGGGRWPPVVERQSGVRSCRWRRRMGEVGLLFARRRCVHRAWHARMGLLAGGCGGDALDVFLERALQLVQRRQPVRGARHGDARHETAPEPTDSHLHSRHPPCARVRDQARGV